MKTFNHETNQFLKFSFEIKMTFGKSTQTKIN